jgi:hypothetical protein
MKTALHCAVMLVVVLIGVTGYTAERLAPYDDFNVTHLNPDNRWAVLRECPFNPRGRGARYGSVRWDHGDVRRHWAP